jgi:hypothetical protein
MESGKQTKAKMEKRSSKSFDSETEQTEEDISLDVDSQSQQEESEEMLLNEPSSSSSFNESPAVKRKKGSTPEPGEASSSDNSEVETDDEDNTIGNSRNSLFRYTLFAREVGKHSVRCKEVCGSLHLLIKKTHVHKSKQRKVRIHAQHINEFINILQALLLECKGLIPTQTVEQYDK